MLMIIFSLPSASSIACLRARGGIDQFHVVLRGHRYNFKPIPFSSGSQFVLLLGGWCRTGRGSRTKSNCAFRWRPRTDHPASGRRRTVFGIDRCLGQFGRNTGQRKILAQRINAVTFPHQDTLRLG